MAKKRKLITKDMFGIPHEVLKCSRCRNEFSKLAWCTSTRTCPKCTNSKLITESNKTSQRGSTSAQGVSHG